MYVFNADGTMQQANPDAGNARTSDSDGKGIWVARRDRVVGKWVEISADRATRKFVGRLDLSFDLKVSGDRLTGSRFAQSFDVNGTPTGEPFQGLFTGTRVTLPQGRVSVSSASPVGRHRGPRRAACHLDRSPSRCDDYAFVSGDLP